MNGDVPALARDILARAAGHRRYVFAIAGAPGAGKSTLADALVAALEALAPGCAALLPMDGFHLDNALLDARGLRARKGAPETFDVAGFAQALDRVRDAGAPVILPVFDRDLDLARAGAREVATEARVIVVEGNYLLLREEPWAGLGRCFDRTLFLSVPEVELERRLVARWRHYGLDGEAARTRAQGNDIPNARRVVAGSRAADVVWSD